MSADDGAADAVAADASGRIVAVGPRARVERDWRDKGTDIVEFGADTTVVPGFVESHVHLILAGEAVHSGSVDCSPLTNASADDVLASLGKAAKGVDPEKTVDWKDGRKLKPFVVGWGYDDALFERKLSRDDIDAACGNVCVLVWHASLHTVYVSSAALRTAGIDGSTPQPRGGVIVHDTAGRPTGELQESPAFTGVRVHMAPGPGSSQRDLSVLKESGWAAARTWSKLGVTTVHDMLVAGEKLVALQEASTSPEWPLRIVAYAAGDAKGGQTRVASLPAGRTPGCQLSPMLRVGGVKLIADGAMLLKTCCMRKPYLGESQPYTTMVISPEVLQREMNDAEKRGWSIAVHCNGDAALDRFIAAVRTARATHPGLRPIHRVEHLQTADAEQIEEMKKLGIATSIFPGHLHMWGDYESKTILPPERLRKTYPAGTASRCGLLFGLHSDAPVTPVDPMLSMWAAVTRKGRSGAVLGEDERITLDRALRAMTVDAAALAADSEVGSLETGKLCDLAVLSCDPLSDAVRRDPDLLRSIRVKATVLGGRVVHRA